MLPMKQFSYIIKDEIGLHARPAGLLAKFVPNSVQFSQAS